MTTERVLFMKGLDAEWLRAAEHAFYQSRRDGEYARASQAHLTQAL